MHSLALLSVSFGRCILHFLLFIIVIPPSTSFGMVGPKKLPKETFYELVDRDMNRNEIKMSKFEGKIICLVNVASAWGYTDENYTELVQLVKKYGNSFQVLAFPCNQFAKEEPGTHEEILQFSENFNARDKFVFFEKADVNGGNAREVFDFLKQKLPNKDGSVDISWNFEKFLVDHEGIPMKRYSPETNPLKMVDFIEALIQRKN